MKATVLRCDFHDEVDAVATMTFQVAGGRYEVDVCQDCVDEMTAAGRRLKQRRKTNGGLDAAAVREWAAGAGVEVAARGAIPKAVADEYRRLTH